MAVSHLLLGTNLGNKSAHLALARKNIVKSGLLILKESSIYETSPWGFEHPESFYNQAITIQTTHTPEKLLSILLDIETLMGRIRSTGKYEARIIDIDILFYDELNIQSDSLTVPHPMLHLRRFALAPLCEIAPTLIHPLLNKTIQALLKECPDNGSVKIIDLR